jgi:hypothetical protein
MRTQLLALLLCGGTASTATADVHFSDVTAAAGIDYVQLVSPGDLPALEPIYMSGGAAAGDYDRDGFPDLYVTRLDAPDLLYRNRGDGSFEDVTGAAGLGRDLHTNGAGWGDIDNDGDLDLYVTTMGESRHLLFVNDGHGGFREEAEARGAQLPSPNPTLGYSVAFGDYDGDGWLDLFVGEWRPQPFNPGLPPANARLLRNRGAAQPGFFDDTTDEAGVALDGVVGSNLGTFAFTPRFTDLDGDRWPDLTIAADFGESRLFWNQGDGSFVDGTEAAGVGGDENGMGSAVGDYDGDGRLDWFVTSIFDPDDACQGAPCDWGLTGNRLYRNEGGRVFSDRTDEAGVRDGYWGWGAAFLDYDNDGDLDLGMVNGQAFPFNPRLDQALARFDPDPMRLWRNDGPGPFAEVSAAVGLGAAERHGKGLLTFDYDRDGDLDLFVSNNAGRPVLYRNDAGNRGGWLRVELRGRHSNRDGIGARVTVIPKRGGRAQVQEISGGSHFLSQSEAAAHFGLGDARGLYEVRVEWPASARTTLLKAVRGNRTLVVKEHGRPGKPPGRPEKPEQPAKPEMPRKDQASGKSGKLGKGG